MTARVNDATLPCELAEAPPVAPAPPPEPITLRAHIFFDGTQNNMYNTEAGALEVAWYSVGRRAHRAMFGEGSYENDYSNIARLFMNHPTDRDEDDLKELSLYVEGMGTSRGNTDDITTGVALGMGETGVWQRAIQARDELRSEIRSRCQDLDRPLTVELTSWGFSRGAATARHFIWRVLTGQRGDTLERQLTNDGYTVSNITFIFAGIFDTVASYGLNHDDDVADLRLRSVRLASRVVHLAAADEVRENFRLTNIRSCGGQTEVFLPGVHSDVGGSYRNNVDDSVTAFRLPIDPNGPTSRYAASEFISRSAIAEMQEEQRQRRVRLERDRQWLVEHGWCTIDDATISGSSIRMRRPNIRNSYSFIPLRIMARFAADEGIMFQPELQTRYRPDTALEALQAEGSASVEAYLMAYARRGSSRVEDWTAPRPWLSRLRRHWFHFSAKYDSMGLAPQFFSTEHSWGTDFNHIMHGARKRRVLNG